MLCNRKQVTPTNDEIDWMGAYDKDVLALAVKVATVMLFLRARRLDAPGRFAAALVEAEASTLPTHQSQSLLPTAAGVPVSR